MSVADWTGTFLLGIVALMVLIILLDIFTDRK